MRRQAERVLEGATVSSNQAPARSSWWKRNRAALLPRVLIGAGLVAAALGIGQIGLDTVLQVAGAVALLVIALGAVAVGALAMTLRRRLAELKHLPTWADRTSPTTRTDWSLGWSGTAPGTWCWRSRPRPGRPWCWTRAAHRIT